MKLVLMGHRGVGKSQLLARLGQPNSLDLDAEIEKYCNQSVAEVFKTQGEKEFRKLEQVVFSALLKKYESFVIAVGGGFDPNLIPTEVRAIFVRRAGDEDGRIFLNRPQLETGVGPIEEYRIRFHERNSRFLARADFVYDMPEGLLNESSIEKQIIADNYVTRGWYTLSRQEIHQTAKLLPRFQKIELRTDLLAPDQIESLLNQFPKEKFLVSIRSPMRMNLSEVEVDCDHRFQTGSFQILSVHDDDIEVGIAKLVGNHHFKLCPLVKSWSELRRGHEWQRQDPDRRSFLPRSSDGRWAWYRLLQSYHQKINFVRGIEMVKDQPTVFQMLSLPEQAPTYFAAVLGSPVKLSRSPQTHADFFRARRTLMLAIDLSRNDFAENLKWLVQLGLRYAAVTSPLKEVLYDAADERTESSEKLRAANTLLVQVGKLNVHNTDIEGFQNLLPQSANGVKIAVWGGGGTLNMIRQALPQAVCFSARTGTPREPGHEQITEYSALIWAAPRSAELVFPPDRLKFNEVIDLNYHEDSPGLEFAQRAQIRYTSGIKMFNAQAEAQQRYWQENER